MRSAFYNVWQYGLLTEAGGNPQLPTQQFSFYYFQTATFILSCLAKKNQNKYLAHIIEQPIFRIPNLEYLHEIFVLIF